MAVRKELNELTELAAFLRLDSQLDLKTPALEYVLGLTGTEEGRSLLLSEDAVLLLLLDLSTDSQLVVSRDALLALLNLSGTEKVALKLTELDVTPRLLQLLVDPTYQLADSVCMLLANLTRTEQGAVAFTTAITSGSCPDLQKLVDVFNQTDYNESARFHYLGPVFSNMTQVQQARRMFTDRNLCLLPRLVPHTRHRESLVRRGGMAGLLRNLSFEVDTHPWLLGEDIDILTALMLPLAGPDQFSDEENDQLPLDLQYLPDDKEREADPDIRKMLVETVMKLCSTQFGRKFLRDRGVYLVIRELHRWEKDPEVEQACETLISMLIADEPEPGMQDLHKLDLPPQVAKKFEPRSCTSSEPDKR